MKEPDNYSELLQAVKVIAEHCEMTVCRDCPFRDGLGQCVLHTDVPFQWYDWLPDERGEENGNRG